MGLPRFTAEQSLGAVGHHFRSSGHSGSRAKGVIQPHAPITWDACMREELQARNVPDRVWNACKNCGSGSDCWENCLIDIGAAGSAMNVIGALEACNRKDVR
jgi:hypothetical protein